MGKIAETINGLQHIGLPTNDLEKTVAFYEGLGFSVALRTVNEAAGEQVAFLQLKKLMNEAYQPLYGYSALSQRQIDQYVKMYLPILDLRMVTLITDADDQLLAVGISMPSLAEALQKAHGRLLPMGWYHLAKTIFLKKYPKMLDLLLVAVKPEYQNKGVNALLFSDLIPVYQQLGFEYAESNPELELNGKVQAQWEYFKTEQHKRRRCFVKGIK